MLEKIVVDSSAVIAVLYNEKGQERVIDFLNGALLCTVNLAEVHTKLVKDFGAPDLAWRRLISLNCQICDFDQAHAKRAGELVTIARRFGLSLGDRACLALAIERKATVFTTDRAWKNLDLGIQIEVIR